MNTRTTIAALILAVSAMTAQAAEWTLSGSVAGEQRSFTSDPLAAEQLDGGQGSLLLAPELRLVSDQRRHQLGFVPFLRLDGRADERTHFDVREAYWRYVADDWELLAGVNRVFWGVAESRHLVDTINQADLVEDIDEEDRLGQPMVALAFQRDWGRVEGFALLGFRERTFPSAEGRLRTPLVVNDNAVYESDRDHRRVDLAVRYSHFVGDWDIGVHVFNGTGREPRLLPSPGGKTLTPFYDVIGQLGVDVQHTAGPWLWKFEGLVRQGQGATFGAAVGGFEYTRYQVGNRAADLGLLVEYLYDGRDATAPVTAFDDDVFIGSRLALNDTQGTELLAGAVVDLHDGSIAARLEASRRMNDRISLEVEGRQFIDVDRENPLAAFRDDSVLTARVSVYF